MRPFVWIALVIGLLTACSSAPRSEPEPESTPQAAIEYRIQSVTVLSSESHGPQLCYAVRSSLPPQCGGPDVRAWDWSAADHEERAGVRWGTYDLVGTWDGESLTLTQPAAEPTESRIGSEPDFTSQCPDPKAIGPATDADFNRATAVARKLGGVADIWIDQNLAAEELPEETSNDPNRFILNVSTRGDLTQAETALRQVWPGRLCVSKAKFSDRELKEIRKQVRREFKTNTMTMLALDHGFGQVNVTVWRDIDSKLQTLLDERFGPGVVVVTSLLQPV